MAGRVRVDPNSRRRTPGGSRAMNPDRLSERERGSFDRAMSTVDGMTDEERRALVAHAVAASIRHATERDAETLPRWCSGLLRTVRVHADPQYRAARDRPRSDGSGPRVRLSE